MKKGLLVLFGALLLVPSLIFADGEKQIDFHGMAQYRLRYNMNSTQFDSVDATSANDYMDKVAYSFGAKVQVNEELFMQMEMGNKHIATETVGWMNNTSMFHLAYATWNPGALQLTIGLQPVKGTPTLDLLERSISTDTYEKAAHICWAVMTTNSLAGIKLSVPLLKGDRSLSLNVLSSPLLERGAIEGTDDTRISSPSAILVYVDVPFKQGPLSIAPNVAIILNRNVFDDNVFVNDGADMEFGFGLTSAFTLNDGISFNAGFGMAGFSNENTIADSIVGASGTVVGPAVYKRSGMYATIGTAIKMGPGTAKVAFAYNSDENTEIDDSKSSYSVIDTKYAYAANKNFTIMPRFRVYMTTLAENDMTNDSKMTLRPELIFIGKF